MKDICWTFSITVRTDSVGGQPSQQDMAEILAHMQAQLETLTDEYGYDYCLVKAELKSDE
jgi:hypothetical protein